MKKPCRVAVLALTLAAVYRLLPTAAHAAPVISNITSNSDSVPRFAKYELTFQVQNTSAQNFAYPYDPAPPPGVPAGTGISVSAEFSPDNWQTIHTQPAFFYQDFTWDQRGGRDWAYPSGQASWKVRFAPHTTGTWQYRLTAADSGGTAQSPAGNFTVTASQNPGYVRVSPADPRYFQFDSGAYFPGLGFAFNANTQDIEANTARLQTFNHNGIQLLRTWISSWSIWGSQWNPWFGMPNVYDGYLPRSGLEAFDGDFRLKLVYRNQNPADPACSENCSYWKATRFIGWMSNPPAVKTNTIYRIRVKYRAQNLSGPRITSSPNYGLVAKISSSWLDGSSAAQPNAINPGSGTLVTGYGGNTASWQEITGTWNSGANNFLPFFYLTLENVLDPGALSPAPLAYIDSVAITEDAVANSPNILNKPVMNHLTYFDQRQSFAFDKLLNLAETNGVFLRPVIQEKQEYLQNHIDFSGVLRTDDPPGLFYGNGRTVTAVRWLQQAYWRYLQARWGYSTAIHSWELINEGDPGLTNHFILTDELAKYMHTFTPSRHLVSTSNWHSFPASSWANMANIDFADLHAYISTGGWLYGSNTALRDAMITDTARYHLEYSQATRNLIQPLRPMPVIRGEAGIDMYSVNGSNQNEQPELSDDTQGTWLRHYLWAGLSPGGMVESYWWTNNIHSAPGPDGVTGLYELYRSYSQFLADIPLANGQYQPLSVTVPSGLRAVGQIDAAHNRAHLWVHNLASSWRQDIDGIPVTPVSGILTLSGFAPNQSLPVVRWNTAGGTIESTSTLTTSAAGTLSLSISNLSADTAFKIGAYTPNPSGQPTPTPTPANDWLDFLNLVLHFGQPNTIFDLNRLVRSL